MSNFHDLLDPKLSSRIGSLERNSLHEWSREVHKNKFPQVMGGLEHVDDSSKLQNLIQAKKYRIGVDQDIVHRSHQDFKLLRRALGLSLPGICLPALPKSKTKSAVGLFLNSLFCNPFFSAHDVMKAFLNPQVQNFRSEVKDFLSNKRAFDESPEAVLRWFQALSYQRNTLETADLQTQKAFFEKLRNELKVVSKQLKALHLKIMRLMVIQQQQAVFNSQLSDVVQNVLSSEINMKSLNPDNGNELNRSSKLESTATRTVKAFHAQTNLLSKEYGSPMIQKKLLDPLEQERSLLSTWIQYINITEAKAKAYDNRQKKIREERNVKTKLKLEKRQSKLRQELSFAFNGLFGMELNTYKRYREVRLERILKSISYFHLTGAEKTSKIWDCEFRPPKVELDKYDVQEVVANKKLIRKSRKLIEIKMKELDKFDPVVLAVTEDVNSKRVCGKKALLVKRGDRLVGHRARDPYGELWFVIDGQGRKGYVENCKVYIKEDEEVCPLTSAKLQTNTGSFSTVGDLKKDQPSFPHSVTTTDENLSAQKPAVPKSSFAKKPERSTLSLPINAHVAAIAKISEAKQQKQKDDPVTRRVSLPVPGMLSTNMPSRPAFLQDIAKGSSSLTPVKACKQPASTTSSRSVESPPSVFEELKLRLSNMRSDVGPQETTQAHKEDSESIFSEFDL